MADPAPLAGRPPAPFRQLTRPRSRALWARGGHYGASQVPGCDNLGPGGIDIDHLIKLDAAIARELPEPAHANGTPIRLGPRAHPRATRGGSLIPGEPKGAGADWTEERGTSDEGRRRLEGRPGGEPGNTVQYAAYRAAAAP